MNQIYQLSGQKGAGLIEADLKVVDQTWDKVQVDLQTILKIEIWVSLLNLGKNKFQLVG